jgi:hypothetical protein
LVAGRWWEDGRLVKSLEKLEKRVSRDFAASPFQIRELGETPCGVEAVLDWVEGLAEEVMLLLVVVGGMRWWLVHRVARNRITVGIN